MSDELAPIVYGGIFLAAGIPALQLLLAAFGGL